MDEKDKRETESIIYRYIGVMMEDFQHKLDIVVEGNQMRNEKIDRVQYGLTDLTARVDRIEPRMMKMEQRQEKME